MKGYLNDKMPVKDALKMKYKRFDASKDQFTSMQFKTKEPRVPIKAIMIAFFMFISGSVMIIIGALLYSGHIDAEVNLIKI